MAFQSPGLGDVGSYQVSGTPFTHTQNTSFNVAFKFVASSVTVICTAENAGNFIKFGPGTSNVHLPKGATRFNVRCREVNITRGDGNISIVAELTGIQAQNMTGSLDANLYGTIS